MNPNLNTQPIFSSQNSQIIFSSDNSDIILPYDDSQQILSNQISQPIPSSQNSQPITQVSFHIGETFEKCNENLTKLGYITLKDNIRIGVGGKNVALWYKKTFEEIYNPYKYYITNIIGVVSEKEMPSQIVENVLEYNMITDIFGNGDINKGSGGFYIYLYYITNERLNIKPIKELQFDSHKNKDHFNKNLEKIMNSSSNSIKKGCFDINSGRGGGSPFNYIMVIR